MCVYYQGHFYKGSTGFTQCFKTTNFVCPYNQRHIWQHQETFQLTQLGKPLLGFVGTGQQGQWTSCPVSEEESPGAKCQWCQGETPCSRASTTLTIVFVINYWIFIPQPQCRVPFASGLSNEKLESFPQVCVLCDLHNTFSLPGLGAFSAGKRAWSWVYFIL